MTSKKANNNSIKEGQIIEFLGHTIKEIPISKIHIDNLLLHSQDEAKIKALVESIKEAGLINPIILTQPSESDKKDLNIPEDKDYLLIDGYLRLKAFERLGAKKIPARIIHVGGLGHILKMRFRSNSDRFENDIELTVGFIRHLKYQLEMDNKAIARITGYSERHIIRLLQLSDDDIKAIKQGNISLRQVLEAKKAKIPKEEKEKAEEVKEKKPKAIRKQLKCFACEVLVEKKDSRLIILCPSCYNAFIQSINQK